MTDEPAASVCLMNRCLLAWVRNYYVGKQRHEWLSDDAVAQMVVNKNKAAELIENPNITEEHSEEILQRLYASFKRIAAADTGQEQAA